jgi:TetR/AcrR family transcriptional repressor of mexCD-oprJ operon
VASDQQPRRDVRERIVDGVLEAAARVIARNGDSASMIDVAREAGVARATLYRYFASRGALEDAVIQRGVTRGSAAIRAARIGEVPVEEGVARAVRALLDLHEALVVIMRRRAGAGAPEFDAQVAGPLRHLLHDGQRDGRVRDDVPIAWLTDSLMNLAAGAVAAAPAMGREDMVATVSSFFMEGAAAHPTSATRNPAPAARSGGER